MNCSDRDIADLVYNLKQEKFFIDYEKQQLHVLNEKVVKAAEEAFQACFLLGEQQRNYYDLLHPNSSPAACCNRANLLLSLHFLPSHEKLGRLDGLYGSLLLELRERPSLMARLLSLGEVHQPRLLRPLLHTLLSSLYAGCIMTHDHALVLVLLRDLLQLQVCNSPDPRRLLRHGSCTFSQIFKMYLDVLPEAKVFLSAALHVPLLQVLSEDDLYLDMDPSKASMRFPPQVRFQKFGQEGTVEYEAALEKYRNKVIIQLAKMINRFLNEISSAMQCFPPTLLWLTRTLYKLLLQRAHGGVGNRALHATSSSDEFRGGRAKADVDGTATHETLTLSVSHSQHSVTDCFASSGLNTPEHVTESAVVAVSGRNGDLHSSTEVARTFDSTHLQNCRQLSSDAASSMTSMAISEGLRSPHYDSQPDTNDVVACCVDLVFVQFVCPALVEPELYGICDAPVSPVARFNLMQVAQCLQSLALARCQAAPDARLVHLQPHLHSGVMAEMVSSILDGPCSDQPPMGAGQQPGSRSDGSMVRDVCLIPHPHLINLLQFLRAVLPLLPPEDEALQAPIKTLLTHMPAPPAPTTPPTTLHDGATVPATTTKKGLIDRVKSSTKSRISKIPTESHGDVDGTASSGEPSNSESTSHGSAASLPVETGSAFTSSAAQSTAPIAHTTTPNAISNNINHVLSSNTSTSPYPDAPELGLGYDGVLVVMLGGSGGVMPGMMAEEKVLAAVQCSSSRAESCARGSTVADCGDEEGRGGCGGDEGGGCGGDDGGGFCGGSSTGGGSNSSRGAASAGEMIIEKRTRFSLSHDDGSIGNTSDNLEAVSEAASNHSVASSLDDVEQGDQPDNLSDMMSANVSGRGTPNVSGRDTPSSQITEEEEEEADVVRRADARAREEPRMSPVPNIAVAVPKPGREDIEEKFGKFEIKPLAGGDETFSLVSDTWSTDVLASDSETIEAVDRELREERQDLHDQLLNSHLQELDRMQGTGIFRSGEAPSEIFETASEAWSTDVLTSDSERLQEFDTDDSQSVARSDDAGRSEVDEGAMAMDRELFLRPDLVQPSSTPDNITPRALQSRSPVDILVARELRPEHSTSIVKDASSAMGDSAAACNKGNSSCTVLRTTPVLPAALSLDSSNACSSSGTLKPLPVMYVCNGGKDLSLPASAPPTVGFRPVVSVNSTGKFELPGSSIQSSNISLFPPDIRQRDKYFNTNATKLLTSTSLDVAALTRDVGKIKVSSNVSDGNSDLLCFTGQENHILNRKMHKLTSGCSKEDNSFHLSTTSLASSTSSSDMNGGHSKSHTYETSKSNLCELVNVDETNTATNDYCDPVETLPLVNISPGLAPDADAQAELDNCLDENGPDDGAGKEQNLSSTGAIPKSISFDQSAEQGGDRDFSDVVDSKNKKSFFKNLKLPFKGRRKGGGGSSIRVEEFSHVGKGGVQLTRRLLAEPIITESTDDILAKYRGKAGPVTVGDREEPDEGKLINGDPEPDPEDAELPCLSDVSTSFDNIKRKLRLVLSVANLPCPSSTVLIPGQCTALGFRRGANSSRRGALSGWLWAQMAEARGLQDRDLLAQLTEAHRCLTMMDAQMEQRVLAALQEDHLQRAPYIAYLVRAVQGLLATLQSLGRIRRRLHTATALSRRALVRKCVQLFLERRELQFREFTRSFTTLRAPDEKVMHVSAFLDQLSHQMKADAIWRSMRDHQLASAEAAVEQAVMSYIYDSALFPNGEVDINRDQVLREHILKLSEVINPDHKDLRIPKLYQHECPWPSAQQELGLLAAYRTAGDKLRCVVRATEIVLNLLSLAHSSSVPAADDCMPVLIFVIIKANPRHLLSTIQYVNVYYEHRFEGAQQYYWTQFCSAVEFIKTMDYID